MKTYIIAADDSAEPIDTEAFVHTVGYVKDGKIIDFLYDSFIFMPQPNFLYDHTPGGTGEKHPMNKAQWTDFIENQEFMSGMNIDALNGATGIVKKELGNSDYKSHAFLSIFYPHNDMHEFGEVDGVNLDLSVLENKKKALKWMVDKSIEEFNKRNYEHIDLGGFYWFYEDIDMKPEEHNEEFLNIASNTEGFQAVADVFRQLSDGNRVRIFWILCHCEECVTNLSVMMGMSSPAISHHLRQLKNAGLIISLVVVFTPLAESIAFRVRVPRMVFIAGVIAVVGVCLLVSADGFATPTLGDLLVLAAAAVRSVHVTAVSALTRGRGFSALNLTLVQSAVCAVVYTLADYQGVLQAVRSFDAGEWIGVLYLGLACSVFAFLIQTWAIQQTSASRVSLLMGTEPIWAVLIGITIGRESLTLLGIVGAALIITGTYLGLRSETRHRAAPMPGNRDVDGKPQGLQQTDGSSLPLIPGSRSSEP